MASLGPRYLVVLVAGLCATAFAQEPVPADPIARVEVKGTAASYDPRRDDTATRIVIGREEIARYGDASVLDVFKRIPGVTVTTGSGRSLQVQIRGLGAGYTQVLVNGERMSPGFAIDTLSPEQVERIEVLRSATAEMSTQSVAGTINIVLRKAARKREREVKLGYLHSSDFHGPTLNLQLGESGERSSYSVSATGSHENFEREALGFEENTAPGGMVDLRRATVVPERGYTSKINLGPRFNWKLENGDTLSWENLVNAVRFRNRAHPQVTTFVGNPPPVPDLHTRAEGENTLLKSDLRWTHTLASGAKLETKLGLENTARRDFHPRSGVDSRGRPATDGSVFAEVRWKGVSSTGKYTRAFEGGHVLALGWDAGGNESDELRAERDTVRPLPPGQLPDETFTAKVARFAVYAQDEWEVTPQWSVYLGARWEGIRTRVAGNTVEDTRVRSSVLSPVFQTLYKLPGGKGDQLRLAVSRTYKAPGLESLVPRRQAWENNSATEADYQGNPALEPELAWGIDAGWEHYWAEGAMVSASTSLRRIDNYTSNRVYFDGLRWIFTPSNEDRATLRSLELEAKFPLKALMKAAPEIDLRANVSRNWSRVASVPGPDNRMEQQTPLSANLGVDYKAGALTAGGNLVHRSGGFVRVAANRGYYSPAHTDLETYAVWKFNPKVQLRVAASNLLNEDNAFEISYTDPLRGTEKRGWTYPEGVKLRTTLEMKF
ncbi:TonB-dependent receptor plug domain-containing protein [Massilia niabensis]|uniref:TonB-dependent receptor plug domain-containing protein n=1 Tax=Massilia niabensis TaxID=544910 RepID=A0ABW0L7H3_9BURK